MMALDGLVVLDLARRYPGAYTAMFLADFGADVIKVDQPKESKQTEASAAYFAPNRNKRSIIIDLRNGDGREVFYRLVKRADVLIDPFRPGVMKRLGADYETVSQMNPRLVYCALSGFGQTGPYAGMPGHDMNYIAIAGALSMIGPRNGPPCFPSNYLADMAGAGLHGAVGILIALMAREKTGRGQFVDIAYMDSVISLLNYDAYEYFSTGKVPRRGETPTTGGAPWAQVLKCRDGEYYTIACAEEHMWKNMCKALGRDDLIPSYRPSSVEERDRVVAELQAIFRARTRVEWFEFFKDKDTCTGPVYYLNETFQDPQVLHRKMLLELDHPKVGKVKQVGIPIKLSDTPGEVRSLGTLPGAHSKEILTGLGYTRDQIDRLKTLGAVGGI